MSHHGHDWEFMGGVGRVPISERVRRRRAEARGPSQGCCSKAGGGAKVCAASRAAMRARGRRASQPEVACLGNEKTRERTSEHNWNKEAKCVR